MQNEHDNAVDKVLAALRDAAPPEGMDARIAHRLANTPPAASRLRDLFAGYSPASAWRRGAITGAAFATLAIGGLLFFSNHLLHTHSNHPQTAIGNTNPMLQDLSAHRTSHSQPCASPNAFRVHSIAPARHIEILPSVVERSRPLPAEPLTAQERDLVRLVHTSDPQQLATLNPETQAKMQAQDEAEFNKFFAPPTSTKSTGDNE